MIGSFRHKITVEEKTETSVGGGVSTHSWATAAIVRGEVEPVSDREYLYGQQRGHAVTHRVKMRNPIARTNGVEFVPTTGNCRLLYDDRTLHVVAVRRERERQRSFWVVSAVEKVD